VTTAQTYPPPDPERITQEHLAFLDDLRESGETNMFGAGPFLMAQFAVDRKTAREILGLWMKTYSARHPKGQGGQA
jgi:uncharacterized protein YciI